MLFLDDPEVILKWMLLHVNLEVTLCEFLVYELVTTEAEARFMFLVSNFTVYY
jgi:hypothetical protein